MIKGKFSTLVETSCKRLQSREVDVEAVKTHLIIIYSSPDSRDGSETVTTVLESAKSLDAIFFALTKHGCWNYLNYYLLQHIIKKFAVDDNELNDMMGQYQKDLTGYVLTMQIQTYLDTTTYMHSTDTTSDDTLADKIVSALPPQQKCELFKKLSVKTEANITDHSLVYVQALWHLLSKQLALPRPALILHKVAEGCISITWLVPANLVKHITRMAQETSSMFVKQRIVRVMLEERCIYPMEIESPLQESEAAVVKRKVNVIIVSLPVPAPQEMRNCFSQ